MLTSDDFRASMVLSIDLVPAPSPEYTYTVFRPAMACRIPIACAQACLNPNWLGGNGLGAQDSGEHDRLSDGGG